MIKGFKDFVLRGNVVDLAVAVVLGAAFSKVIGALVDGIITPLVAALFGKPNLDAVGGFSVNGAQFKVGVVLTQALNFVLVALALYVLVVVPMNRLLALRRRGVVAEPASPAEDVVVLREIRDLLSSRAQ